MASSKLCEFIYSKGKWSIPHILHTKHQNNEFSNVAIISCHTQNKTKAMHNFNQCIEIAVAINKDQKIGKVNIDRVWLVCRYTFL